MSGTDLYWLPDPDDWDQKLAAVRGITDRDLAWQAMVALASMRLDAMRTNRLDRIYRAFFADYPPDTLAARPIRLAVFSSSNIEHLLPGLRIGALRRGLWVSTYTADYGQYFQELSNPPRALVDFAPTEILISLDAHHLTRGLDPLASADEAAAFQKATLAHLLECWRLSRKAFNVPVIQQTVLPIFKPLLGSNEHRLPGSRTQFVLSLNRAIRDVANDVDLVSVDTRCESAGVELWHQPSMWLRAKQEIAHGAAPLYGDLVARLMAARRGRSFKCLVLDLDNTIWGGEIGDDGVGGIVLGQGSASGESFLALQDYAKSLAGRGIILAVCSKNDDGNARRPFIEHPDMVLRLDDISAFVANWDDKAKNLRLIAETLNIGLDALVFVDDNPFERNLVRSELPMVAVPEVPDDAVLVAACLADAGYFESLGLTDEDRHRVGQYRANDARSSFEARAADLGTYLRGLEMKLVCKPFDRDGLARITQLINKTNQFNLTTRRYTAEEVEAVITSEDTMGHQFRLVDRFGDNGMIAVVIGHLFDQEFHIETWLMSCRVFGRHVEQATLQVVAQDAKRRGARRLVGLFKPSKKNAMVSDLFKTLGFTLAQSDVDGSTTWTRDLAELPGADDLIEITHE